MSLKHYYHKNLMKLANITPLIYISMTCGYFILTKLSMHLIKRTYIFIMPCFVERGKNELSYGTLHTQSNIILLSFFRSVIPVIHTGIINITSIKGKEKQTLLITTFMYPLLIHIWSKQNHCIIHRCYRFHHGKS